MGKDEKLFIGIDVGGTKILAALVEDSGKIIERERQSVPSNGSPKEILAVIGDLVDHILEKEKIKKVQIQGAGLAIPGVVDPDKGKVIVTPNMNLSGVDIIEQFQKRRGEIQAASKRREEEREARREERNAERRGYEDRGDYRGGRHDASEETFSDAPHASEE